MKNESAPEALESEKHGGKGRGSYAAQKTEENGVNPRILSLENDTRNFIVLPGVFMSPEKIVNCLEFYTTDGNQNFEGRSFKKSTAR